jgi:hypothetical protein
MAPRLARSLAKPFRLGYAVRELWSNRPSSPGLHDASTRFAVAKDFLALRPFTSKSWAEVDMPSFTRHSPILAANPRQRLFVLFAVIR